MKISGGNSLKNVIIYKYVYPTAVRNIDWEVQQSLSCHRH